MKLYDDSSLTEISPSSEDAPNTSLCNDTLELLTSNDQDQTDESYIAHLNLELNKLQEELITKIIDQYGIEGLNTFVARLKEVHSEEKKTSHDILKGMENHQKVWSNNNKSALFIKDEEIAEKDLAPLKKNSWSCNIV